MNGSSFEFVSRNILIDKKMVVNLDGIKCMDGNLGTKHHAANLHINYNKSHKVARAELLLKTQ